MMLSESLRYSPILSSRLSLDRQMSIEHCDTPITYCFVLSLQAASRIMDRHTMPIRIIGEKGLFLVAISIKNEPQKYVLGRLSRCKCTIYLVEDKKKSAQL